jgi:ketosteroid isomerase-like protein
VFAERKEFLVNLPLLKPLRPLLSLSLSSLSLFSLSLCTQMVAAAECKLDTVAQHDSDLNHAISAHDVDAASRYYADAFVLTTSRGGRKTTADMLAEIASTTVQLEINQTHDIQVFGNAQTAILTATLHQKGRVGDQTFDAEVLVTDTWICAADGRWLLLAGHASRRS